MSEMIDRHELRVRLEREEAIAKNALGAERSPLVTVFFDIIYQTLNKMPFESREKRTPNDHT